MDTYHPLGKNKTKNQAQLPLSQQEGFIALPSDPAVRLTREQLEILMGGAENKVSALAALREIVGIVRSKAGGDDAA